MYLPCSKTPTKQRDIFRPKLFYSYKNLRPKNSQCTIKTQRNSKKRKLWFILAHFQGKQLIYYFCEDWPHFVFFWHYATYRVTKIFSQLLVFEVFREGKKFPCLGSGIFDHAELMSFLIDCGKHLISDFSILWVFPKLSFGRITR